MSKKVSYMGLLKEAISEFDTSKSVDVKGPMLDPILSYSGGGELPTHKDAASILERYYFQEEEDTGVSVVGEDTLAADDNDVDAIPGKDPKKTRADVEKELTEEEDTVEEGEAVEEATEVEDEDESDEAAEVADEDEEKEEEEVEESASVELENSVIEKLIAEMEDEEESDTEEMEEANRVAGDRGAQGEEAMGTGNADDQVPPRKDITKEQDEADDAEEEVKDVDAEVAEEGMGPVDTPAASEEEDAVEEAFKIFEKEIMDLDDDDIEV